MKMSFYLHPSSQFLQQKLNAEGGSLRLLPRTNGKGPRLIYYLLLMGRGGGGVADLTPYMLHIDHTN